MKKETVKKPRKPRTTLLSVLRDDRIENIKCFLRSDGRISYLITLKKGFMLCNLLKESTSEFVVVGLCEIPPVLGYVQEMPF